MTEFNVLNIAPILDKNNIESTTENCYLFIMFLLQRCQLISNIIKIISKKEENHLSIGIKYCILYEDKFVNIHKKMNEFKKEFDKNDLINEILSFIKTTIENPVLDKKIDSIDSIILPKTDTKPLLFKSKIQSLFTEFSTIKLFLDNIDNSLIVEEKDISNYLSENDSVFIKSENRKKLDKEITQIELNWLKYKRTKNNKNKEIYELLKYWFNL